MRRVLFCLVLFGLAVVACWSQHGWAAIDGILLKDCPTSYGEYSARAVVSDYQLTEVLVYRNGKLMQTIRPDGEAETLAAPVYGDGEEQLIHFPDANNDGYRDLFVGPGGSRSANSLYLFNPKKKRFELCVSASDMQNPLFCPQEGAIYDGGSSSAWEFFMYRSVWNGNLLEPVENLEITENLAEYNRNTDPEYRKTHKYIFTDVQGGKEIKTNKLTDLPGGWQLAVKMMMK